MEKNKIITSEDARCISLKYEVLGIESIMDKIVEYATQGKTEFEIRDRVVFTKWEGELAGLGYKFKKPERGAWIISWSKNYQDVQDKSNSIKEKFDALENVPDMAQLITMYESAIDFAGEKLRVLPTEIEVVDFSPTEYELSSIGLYLIVDKKTWHYHLRGYAEKYFFIKDIIR